MVQGQAVPCDTVGPGGRGVSGLVLCGSFRRSRGLPELQTWVKFRGIPRNGDYDHAALQAT